MEKKLKIKPAIIEALRILNKPSTKEEVLNCIITNELTKTMQDNPMSTVGAEMGRMAEWPTYGLIKKIENGNELFYPINLKNYNKNNDAKNLILYGPPGTGKTYNTINKAIEIIDKNFYELHKENTDENRKLLKERFEFYTGEGQIEFVTFHQSYGYEEFVEGIRAKTDEENNRIKYEIEPGIFKKLCQRASDKEVIVDGLKVNNDTKIWKISLGGTYEHPIKTKCFRDNEIRIGWNDIHLGDEKYNSLGTNDQSTIKNFIDDMEPGDIVVSIWSQNEIDGIGIIESDYLQDDNSEYNKVRKVKWLSKEKIINVKELNDNKILVQKTVYPIKRIKPNELLSKIDIVEKKEDNANKNYILIVDEINRGNISKIFGELITLIESSKRIGQSEEINLKLPYSGESFGVPSNLYIIGTMNTADRSIAPIDTALRRRFVFEEMAPNQNLLNKDKIKVQLSKENDTDTGIELDKLLEAINTRIEYLYDRDHTIGHAYLIDVKTLCDLKFAFKNKIIPLLAEYFYEDWENIDLILNNNGFIEDGLPKEDYLSKLKSKVHNKKIYKVSDDKNWNSQSFIKIYEDMNELTNNKENEKTDIE